jgi:hypothetical protein
MKKTAIYAMTALLSVAFTPTGLLAADAAEKPVTVFTVETNDDKALPASETTIVQQESTPEPEMIKHKAAGWNRDVFYISGAALILIIVLLIILL